MGIVLVVGNGYRELILMPSETGIVEIDYMYVFASCDEVARVQVGVNQAEVACSLP